MYEFIAGSIAGYIVCLVTFAAGMYVYKRLASGIKTRKKPLPPHFNNMDERFHDAVESIQNNLVTIRSNLVQLQELHDKLKTTTTDANATQCHFANLNSEISYSVETAHNDLVKVAGSIHFFADAEPNIDNVLSDRLKVFYSLDREIESLRSEFLNLQFFGDESDKEEEEEETKQE